MNPNKLQLRYIFRNNSETVGRVDENMFVQAMVVENNNRHVLVGPTCTEIYGNKSLYSMEVDIHSYFDKHPTGYI